MRKIIFLSISIFVFSFTLPTSSFAQRMSHTAREEAEGKAVWEKLQTKELICKDLSDDNFGALGEYFMGQMVGEQHEAMNNMMMRMMGKEGEEQMHMAMGKRMSNCEPDAQMPQNMPALSGVEGMPMMMGGGMMGNFGTNPMSWLGWGFSWILMILFWVVVVVSIIALIVWLIRQIRGEVKTNEK